MKHTARVLLMTVTMVPFLGLLMASFACPTSCTCRWKGGKETAECVGHRLTRIPIGLSRGTQVLDISKNNLRSLQKEAFLNVGLQNLQKVYIAECKLRKIDDSAFSHLANLVELDLGGNLLIAVPSETFPDYPELRRLILNNNPIRRIESKAFVKLPYLALLEISNCFLEYVGPKAFHGLNNLQHLKLDGNKLTTLPADVGFPLKSLLSLDIFDNPWVCDCHLRVLRNWLTNDGLPVNSQPICAQPERLEGRWLIRVYPDEYACIPEATSYSSLAEAYLGESAKLVCSVQSDPPPTIQWFRYSRAITNSTRVVGRAVKFFIHERGMTNRLSILSISMTSTEDSGEYICMAENLAGQIVINITLEVVQRSVEASSLTNGHIAGISIALILVSVVTIIFICVLLAKMKNQHSEETKHLAVDKNKGVHCVNHVKFDVAKEKLEVTTRNSVHRPLCSVVNSNYNSNTPIQDKIHLEDAIGGSYRVSSCINSNKPDVVNFTCAPNSPEENENEVFKEQNLKKNSGQFGHLDKDSVCYEKERYFTSRSRTESKESLCDYVQLYEDSAKAVSREKLHECSGIVGSLSGQDWERTGKSGCDQNDAMSPVRTFNDDCKNQSCGPKLCAEEKGSQWINKEDVTNNANGRHIGKINKNPPPVPSRRYGPFGHATGILKHVNLHGRNYVPVLPPLPVHHFAQARDSPDEGYEDEVEEEMDM